MSKAYLKKYIFPSSTLLRTHSDVCQSSKSSSSPPIRFLQYFFYFVSSFWDFDSFCPSSCVDYISSTSWHPIFFTALLASSFILPIYSISLYPTPWAGSSSWELANVLPTTGASHIACDHHQDFILKRLSFICSKWRTQITCFAGLVARPNPSHDNQTSQPVNMNDELPSAPLLFLDVQVGFFFKFIINLRNFPHIKMMIRGATLVRSRIRINSIWLMNIAFCFDLRQWWTLIFVIRLDVTNQMQLRCWK